MPRYANESPNELPQWFTKNMFSEIDTKDPQCMIMDDA